MIVVRINRRYTRGQQYAQVTVFLPECGEYDDDVKVNEGEYDAEYGRAGGR